MEIWHLEIGEHQNYIVFLGLFFYLFIIAISFIPPISFF